MNPSDNIGANKEQPPAYTRTLRIVFVSPSDIEKECELIRTAVEIVNLHLGRFFGISFELYHWKDLPPGLYEGGPQAKIDEYLKINQADVVIGAMWKKFGTPIDTGETPTEHEIREAHRCWLSARHPELMLYFNGDGVPNPTPTELDQLKLVRVFREEFLPRGLVADYSGPDGFKDRIQADLMNVMARAVAAQITPESIPCSLSVEPKMLRSEGIAELIGEVRISLPRRPELEEIDADVHVYLNTNITNKTDSSHVSTESILIVEPSPEDSKSYPVISGKLVGANTLVFESVKLPLAGSGGLRVLRILGIRANACQVTPPGTASKVISFLKIESKSHLPISILNPQVTAGFCYPGLVVSSGTATFEQVKGINVEYAEGRTDRLEINLNCTLSENFPDAFKNRTQESIAGAYPGPIGSSVMVEHGTLFEIAFTNVPPGIRVFGTAFEESKPSRIRIVEPTYDESKPAGFSSQGPMIELRNTLGGFHGRWEWVSDHPMSPLRVESVSVGFALVASRGKATIGHATIYASLAPHSTIQTCCSTAPVPRFCSVEDPSTAFACNESP
jgi:hypothetical protein